MLPGWRVILLPVSHLLPKLALSVCSCYLEHHWLTFNLGLDKPNSRKKTNINMHTRWITLCSVFGCWWSSAVSVPPPHPPRNGHLVQPSLSRPSCSRCSSLFSGAVIHLWKSPPCPWHPVLFRMSRVCALFWQRPSNQSLSPASLHWAVDPLCFLDILLNCCFILQTARRGNAVSLCVSVRRPLTSRWCWI